MPRDDDWISSLKNMAQKGIDRWFPNEDDPLLLLIRSNQSDEIDLLAERHAVRHLVSKTAKRDLSGVFSERMQIIFGIDVYADWTWQRRKQEVAFRVVGRRHGWNSYRQEPYVSDLRIFSDALKLGVSSAGALTPVDPVAPQGYLISSYTSYFDLSAGTNLITRELEAVRDGVSFWEGPHYSDGFEKQEFALQSGGAKLITYGQANRGGDNHSESVMVRVEFPYLKRGETFKFSLLRTMKFDLAATSTKNDVSHRHIAPQQTVAKATFEVAFPVDWPDPMVWGFRDLLDWEVPGPAVDQRDTLLKEHVARFTQTYPSVGRATGLGWKWDR